MQGMLEFARGPLFALTFGIMVLGLLRLVLIQVYSLVTTKGRRLKNAPWRQIIGDTLRWVVPFRQIARRSVLFSAASFCLHIGLILVPIFLAEHVLLWNSLLGLSLPAIGRTLADVLVVTTLASLVVILGCRTFIARQRAVSTPIDYFLLIIIAIPFATGFLAMHPTINPFPWDALMLTHLLSAELLFVLVPTTKLAHVVTIFFDRISAVHWQLRPGAGARVAEALFGSEAKV